ncbi:hypothetical protein HYPSUDRAFT_127126 [Hypholoma sublateritium FD-334 SS-4]|uniref:1-alkyl-2-acetylglycerophosphocholine esterase n=1 Tax=Hypholoma sublateritium (strain FD-334 SS-4) TaxID=945553 RepID=A0A0D2N0E0_HYPSF|nr:hypothetical protein HYPSUDRAFT_127126 [Hypholoma sublateritium FD-334 SS-4]
MFVQRRNIITLSYPRLFLPTIQGRFPVGVTTFTTPVQPLRSVGSVKLKNFRRARQDYPEHALLLEEVAFTAYYPAEVDASSKNGIPWFIRPIRDTLNGFSTFIGISKWLLWPVLYIFAAFLKIPAYPNAPLLIPKETLQWPLVIFSHGLGGSRTAYSQFCSGLAASGKVVLALEHRDGTGIACRPRLWNQGSQSDSRMLLYLRESDVHWDDDDAISVHPLPLRGQQLEFRHHEIHIAYSAFCRLVANDSALQIDTIDGTPYPKQSWAASGDLGLKRVRYENRVMLTGHSFGGCTVLSLLSRIPLEEYMRIPVERAVILDPWLEPLAIPGPVPFEFPSPPTSDSIGESGSSSLEAATVAPVASMDLDTKLPRPRMLVINSEAFTLWKEHYARLQKVVAEWEPQGGHILTILGSAHVSFSDFPVLPIIRKRTARPVLDTITNLSLSFLDDRLSEAIQTIPTRTMEIEIVGVKKDGKPKRKLVGNVGDVIIQ